MIRVVLYLLVVGVLALGAAWIADRPGDIAITWQGWRIETTVMVALIALVVVFLVVMVLWSVLRAILRSPEILALSLRSRRGARGYNAISRGLVAIGSGDMAAARKFADEARRIAPGEPLTLLLAAQAAQLGGDRGAAERTFRAMAVRDDTKLLGLHGLFMEARRRDDPGAARLYAEEAALAAPALAWAGHAVLEFRCAAGDWTGALELVERNFKSGLIDKPVYRRQRAVLLTARALALEEGDPANARTFVLEAAKLAPNLVPAAVLAGRLLGAAGDLRKAGRIVDAAWRANPHPDLADTYAYLRFGDSARDRLTRVQALAKKSPGHIESALAVARAALDAQEFAVARNALAPLAAAPTRRVAMLMAELERTEHGDEGRAREWMTRALHAGSDPAWTADGVVSDRWMPVSPVTGQLDAFQWKVPLAELASGGKVIEIAEQPIAPREPAAAPVPAAAPIVAEDVPAAPAAEMNAGRSRRRRVAPTVADPVIPLVRAPDDPGPEAEAVLSPELPTGAWRGPQR